MVQLMNGACSLRPSTLAPCCPSDAVNLLVTQSGIGVCLMVLLCVIFAEVESPRRGRTRLRAHVSMNWLWIIANE